MSKRYRFIAQEDLEAIAAYLDEVSSEFPVAKIPGLGDMHNKAIAALMNTPDAQDRGLFLSIMTDIQQDIKGIYEQIDAINGRTQLAGQMLPAVSTQRIKKLFEEAPQIQGKASVPGEQEVILDFDDFGGGEL